MGEGGVAWDWTMAGVLWGSVGDTVGLGDQWTIPGGGATGLGVIGVCCEGMPWGWGVSRRCCGGVPWGWTAAGGYPGAKPQQRDTPGLAGHYTMPRGDTAGLGGRGGGTPRSWGAAG